MVEYIPPAAAGVLATQRDVAERERPRDPNFSMMVKVVVHLADGTAIELVDCVAVSYDVEREPVRYGGPPRYGAYAERRTGKLHMVFQDIVFYAR